MPAEIVSSVSECCKYLYLPRINPLLQPMTAYSPVRHVMRNRNLSQRGLVVRMPISNESVISAPEFVYTS